MNTRSYAPSLSRGSTFKAAPAISRKRWVGMPTDRNALRATRWWSASMSTLVRMPSGCMPAKRARPETPEPVPISTTALARSTEARKVSALAPPRPIGVTPSGAAAARASAAASDSATKSSA